MRVMHVCLPKRSRILQWLPASVMWQCHWLPVSALYLGGTSKAAVGQRRGCYPLPWPQLKWWSGSLHDAHRELFDKDVGHDADAHAHDAGAGAGTHP